MLSLTGPGARRRLGKRHEAHGEPVAKALLLLPGQVQPMLGASPQNILRLLGPLVFDQIADFCFVEQTAKMLPQILQAAGVTQQLRQPGAVQPGVVPAQRRRQPGELLF